ncbi:hypothetical protein BCR34DRAFT_593725 [Clohesyomyces aquaticus]|uniref:Uncharacterized protein n=1 Tax=Clohesyomyces aquaticus TaxID=1231657 RepID=A0A1Y1YFP1_9PLEO|nr:hypothetical protein BCR34DRAFT_593725 [Clohesyomyces aquaticus]
MDFNRIREPFVKKTLRKRSLIIYSQCFLLSDTEVGWVSTNIMTSRMDSARSLSGDCVAMSTDTVPKTNRHRHRRLLLISNRSRVQRHQPQLKPPTSLQAATQLQFNTCSLSRGRVTMPTGATPKHITHAHYNRRIHFSDHLHHPQQPWQTVSSPMIPTLFGGRATMSRDATPNAPKPSVNWSVDGDGKSCNSQGAATDINGRLLPRLFKPMELIARKLSAT